MLLVRTTLTSSWGSWAVKVRGIVKQQNLLCVVSDLRVQSVLANIS
jgi:hypothetical protein